MNQKMSVLASRIAELKRELDYEIDVDIAEKRHRLQHTIEGRIAFGREACGKGTSW